MPIPLAKPSISDAEVEAVREVLNSGWLTQGPRVAQFEEQFAARVGAQHACAVANATAGLHLALLGVGVRAGDVVLTVSMSFIATANAIRACGAEPVFVDVDPHTFNMSPDHLAQTLGAFDERDGHYYYRHANRLTQAPSPLTNVKPPVGRLAAILVVHQLGLPAPMNELTVLADKYGVPIVEDAACAIGSELRVDQQWQMIGHPHSRVAVFSFHPRKVLTTGDGGMLATNDVNLDRQFRLWRQHGMSVSDLARHASRSVVTESYEVTGFNYRLTDVQAAVGVVQLSKLTAIVAQRRQIADWYAEQLGDIDELTLPVEPTYARSNWQSYQVLLADAAWQREVMQGLADRGIGVRRGVMCAHLEPPYRPMWEADSLPNSIDCMHRGLILPLYPDLTEDDVLRVAESLRDTLAESLHRRTISCR